MNVANSVYNLAQLNGYQGNYADAEMLYRRALAIYEKARGPNHPDVADAVDSIAYLYKDLVLGCSAPLERWAAANERLLVVAADDPASPRVDEVHLPARLAVHRLIGLAGLIGPIVRDPALDVKARVRAAVEEWRHSSASQRSQSAP